MGHGGAVGVMESMAWVKEEQGLLVSGEYWAERRSATYLIWMSIYYSVSISKSLTVHLEKKQ